ncbi:MAG: hypothetical protein OXI16_15025 [Chloroflexota bacterium]|nr:hypothetical protein [Chloroflexota bacterium]
MNFIVKVSLVALLAAVSGVFFLTGNALAHHYEFRGEEKRERTRTTPTS